MTEDQVRDRRSKSSFAAWGLDRSRRPAQMRYALFHMLCDKEDLEAYAGAARAFDSYQIAMSVFAEHAED